MEVLLYPIEMTGRGRGVPRLTVPITLGTTTLIQLLAPAIFTRMPVRVQFRLW